MNVSPITTQPHFVFSEPKERTTNLLDRIAKVILAIFNAIKSLFQSRAVTPEIRNYTQLPSDASVAQGVISDPLPPSEDPYAQSFIGANSVHLENCAIDTLQDPDLKTFSKEVVELSNEIAKLIYDKKIQPDIAKTRTDATQTVADIAHTLDEVIVEPKIKAELNGYLGFLDKAIRSEVDTIVKEALIDNAKTIAEMLSVDLSSTLETMANPECTSSFPKTFDAIVHDIAQHISAFDAALKVKSPIPDDAAIHNEPAPFDPTFMDKFGNVVKKNNEDTYNKINKPADASRFSTNEENRLVERLIPILFPSKIIQDENGQDVEVSGIQCLWSKIRTPELVKKLMAKTDLLTKNLGKLITGDEIDSVVNKLQPLIAEMGRRFIEDRIQQQLAIGLRNITTHLTEPAYILQMWGESILPVTNELIRSSYACLTLTTPSDALATAIHSHLEKKTDIIPALSEKLYPLMVKNSNKETKSYFEGYTKEDYQKDIRDDVEFYLDYIKEKQKEHPEKLLTQPEIKALIDGYVAEKDSQINIEYGHIVTSLLHIGDPTSWAKNISEFSYIQNLLNQTISTALDPVRKSHTFVIQKTTDFIKELLSDKKKLEDVVLGEPVKPNYPQMVKLTNEQIQTLSNQISDIVYHHINNLWGLKYYAAKFAADKFIGDNASLLKRKILKIITQLFGNQIVNKHLMMQVFNRVLDHFEKAQNWKPESTLPAESESLEGVKS